MGRALPNNPRTGEYHHEDQDQRLRWRQPRDAQ
jgi:hypothetical protein